MTGIRLSLPIGVVLMLALTPASVGARAAAPDDAPAATAAPARVAPARVAADVLALDAGFADHMVLQRDAPLAVRGTGRPGLAVRVSLGPAELATSVAADGRWAVTLPPQPAGGPFTLAVQSDAGAAALERHDILIGDVWLCAGGPNMLWPVKLSKLGLEALVYAGDMPLLRVRTDSPDMLATPDADAPIWRLGRPKDLVDVSAIAWCFGCALQKELNVPIGVIVTGKDITRIEPWIPEAGYRAVPSIAYRLAKLHDEQAGYRAQLPAALDALEAWLDLTGPALAAGGAVREAPAMPPQPFSDPEQPTGLFGRRIAPLATRPIKGVIWYQGEHNIGDESYDAKLAALIAGWRAAWRQPELPFLIVQLPPFRYGTHRHTEKSENEPDPERLPRLWAAQVAALALPHVQLAVWHDLVDPADYNPPERTSLSQRLFALALCESYGRDVPSHGPEFLRAVADGSALRVSFRHAQGLRTRDGKAPDDFELCGPDGAWHPAQASLDGDAVRVVSPDVSQPAGVRLGWTQDARPNLCNAAGLPVRAFRHDMRGDS